MNPTVSLTRHLNNSTSPVRAFFTERLADTGPVVKAAAAALRDGQTRAPFAAAPDVNPGRAGTAVEYLLRFALAPDPCPRGSAGRLGAGMLGKQLSIPAMAAVEDALAFVAEIAPCRRRVTDRQWEQLAEISLLLATFEAVYRSRRSPAAFENLEKPPSQWQDWASLTRVDAEVEDVALLGAASAADHAHLRGRDLACNPVFAQSRALGGADADLITDEGVLIDFKSTSTTRTCSNADMWQLVGYALADTHDELHIRAVALSALRWRTNQSWPLHELLDELAGERIALTSLRDEFATLLCSIADQRRREVERRRRERAARHSA